MTIEGWLYVFDRKDPKSWLMTFTDQPKARMDSKLAQAKRKVVACRKIRVEDDGRVVDITEQTSRLLSSPIT